jgi:dTDP-4-dehydrorhamnose reductase
MKILVLGISGMLGSTAFRLLQSEHGHTVHGTARSADIRKHFGADALERIHTGVDVTDTDALLMVLDQVRPELVMNCIGVVKQLASAKDPLVALPLNALLPHRLARCCALVGARLVHVSTDCVFTGQGGAYTEASFPDADDLYGRSKLLGEVDYPNAITLRTSIIGHELGSCNGLVEWFLSQEGQVRGFNRAIFSGLPTDELTRVVARHVMPRPDLHGVWHVSAAPISKFDLLQLVRRAYGRDTVIEADCSLVIDRSLDSRRFRDETGYAPPDWPTMITRMRDARN